MMNQKILKEQLEQQQKQGATEGTQAADAQKSTEEQPKKQ